VEFVVDLKAVTVVLADPEDTKHFALRVRSVDGASAKVGADVHRLGDVLVSANAGRLVGPHQAFIRPDAVRFHAEGQVADDWPERFDAMCAYAATKGWINPEGWIEAHVEWPEDPPGGVGS